MSKVSTFVLATISFIGLIIRCFIWSFKSYYIYKSACEGAMFVESVNVIGMSKGKNYLPICNKSIMI
jgi:hypothetical protein